MQPGKFIAGLGSRQIVGGEEVILFDDLLLVKSSTRRGVWYEIKGRVCSCEAAQHGNPECHHIRNLMGGLKESTT